jgi:hypothetical protein
MTVIHKPVRAAQTPLATTMRPETLCHWGLRWRKVEENCKAPSIENRLTLRMCTITAKGAATNLAFSELITGLPTSPARRATPAAKGIALETTSTSGIFQSIRGAFFIAGVYESPTIL